MAYSLGVDLGTTFTAAAICRDGRTDMVSLGNRAASIPSLVFLRDDNDVVVGDGAERRGQAEPDRLAREFKRRIGDTTPILLGRSPYSAERLMAMLLRAVVATVSEREGAPAQVVALAHPANWSNYKTDLLRQAAEQAGLPMPMLVSEPVAAAIEHATTERMVTGELVAVYDLGGGTFDAAVLRKTDAGFEVVGVPQGIERLGGIDIDAAVMAHVARVLGDRLEGLDRRDPSVQAGLARLQAECVLAKEALSCDSDTTIVVALPGLQQDVRLTRAELEGMIRPVLKETTLALRRAIDSVPASAGIVGSVLLVGGSSRIPLVADMVAAEVGKPVRLDAHPKHAIALGAARAAAVGFGLSVPRTPTSSTPPASPSLPASSPHSLAPPTSPQTLVAARQSTPFAPADGGDVWAAARSASETTAMDRLSQMATTQQAAVPQQRDRSAQGTPAQLKGGSGNGQRRMLGLAVVVAALVVGGGIAYAMSGDRGGATPTSTPLETSGPTTDQTAGGSDGPEISSDVDATEASVPPEETTPSTTEPPTTVASCSSASGRCVSMDSIELLDDHYVATYSTEGFDPLIFDDGVKGTPEDHHVHFFFDSVAAENAGVNGNPIGEWVVWDRDSGGGTLRFDAYRVDQNDDFSGEPAQRLCVAVASFGHEVEADTASCMELPS